LKFLAERAKNAENAAGSFKRRVSGFPPEFILSVVKRRG
jgi:hypothetical protein